MEIPRTGRPASEILEELESMKSNDLDWRSGRAFSMAYYAGDEAYELTKDALAMYMTENALNVNEFPSLRRMQSEVVSMVAHLLNGGDEAAGFMTTGGTESILMAVKGSRERGRAERGITEPQMIVPTSAHAAFDKGAHYFGLEIVRVPVRDDYKADVDAMAAAVTPNTVLVVGSAPQYPQSVVDPIADIAAIAEDGGFNCHVDACMGGITLPYLERLGYGIPPFDFRIPGVTSMSVDVHKYGYAAKGASVILHRNKALRKYHTFVTDNWLGGFYASSGVLGTKSGGPIAAAWAIMNHLGDEGYERLARQAKEAQLALVAGLRQIDGCEIVGEPEATHVAFRFADCDTFAVGDAVRKRGWFFDKQTPPDSLHATVNAVHLGVVDELLVDLAEVAADVRDAAARGELGAYGALE